MSWRLRGGPALWALALAPPVGLLVLLLRYGVDIPYWDEWILVDLFDRGRDGTLGLLDFWTQHNEHRLFVSRLVLYGLGLATGWNVFAEYLLSYALAVAGFGAVWVLVRRMVPPGPARASALIFASLTVFSLSQWENWLWGWQVAVFLCSSAVLGAIALLTSARPGVPGTTLAAILGVIASLSYGSGLVVWPAGLLALLLSERCREKGRWAALALWSVCGTATAWLYFRNYWRGDLGTAQAGLEGAQDRALYVLGYLGSPLFGSLDAGMAIVAGTLGLLALLALVVVELRERSWFGLVASRSALSLAAFGLGCGVLTALGRLSLGVEQALSSRYSTFSGFFWLGLVLWFHRAWSLSKSSDPDVSNLGKAGVAQRLRRAITAMLAVVLIGHMVAIREGVAVFQTHRGIRGPARAALIEGRYDEPRLIYIYPDQQALQRFVVVSRRLEIGLFRKGQGEALEGAPTPRP